MGNICHSSKSVIHCYFVQDKNGKPVQTSNHELNIGDQTIQ